MKAATASDARYAALLQLLRTSGVLWDASRVLFARWELSPAQFNVLNLLSGRAHGLTQSELGRELLTHRSNVTGLVDRLEQRGLVRRHELAGDRRAWRVSLTPAGRRLLASVLPKYHDAAAAIWGDAPESLPLEVLAILQTLESNARRLSRNAPPETLE